MFGTASMAMIDASLTPEMATKVLQLAEEIGWGSVVLALWTLLVSGSMLCSCAEPRWRRQHLVWSVFFLSFSQVGFLSLTAICTPRAFREHYASHTQQCTLGIEGMVTASRIWGVILLCSEIQQKQQQQQAAVSATYSAARPQRSRWLPQQFVVSCFWRIAHAGKHGFLWVGWAFPAAWVCALQMSGLWDELGLSCWSCFRPDFREVSHSTFKYPLNS